MAKDPLRQAIRVTAPPTADPLAVTTDLYFELANTDGQLRSRPADDSVSAIAEAQPKGHRRSGCGRACTTSTAEPGCT